MSNPPAAWLLAAYCDAFEGRMDLLVATFHAIVAVAADGGDSYPRRRCRRRGVAIAICPNNAYDHWTE